MAKDALGHGSESRGAADALSQNHPKSGDVPVHPAMTTRVGNRDIVGSVTDLTHAPGMRGINTALDAVMGKGTAAGLQTLNALPGVRKAVSGRQFNGGHFAGGLGKFKGK